MPKNNYFVILLLGFALFLGCQKPKKEFSVRQYDPNTKDFSFLKEALEDVRILSIGESSYGFASMHSMKGNLVKYLHKELGYDVLVMQAGYGDVGISWYHSDESSPKQLLNSTVPVPFRCQQMIPLFEHLKSNKHTDNALEYRGMEPKVTGLAFEFILMRTLTSLVPKAVKDSIDNGLEYYLKAFQIAENRAQWEDYMSRYKETLYTLQSLLTDNREDLVELELAGEEAVDIYLRYIDMSIKAVDYEYGEYDSRGRILRDSLMAENVMYFADEEFPNSKIIIWGHNGHIEKSGIEGDQMKWLGHYLKEKYGDKYYSLGMFVKKGYIFQSDKLENANFNIQSEGFIETKLDKDYGKKCFYRYSRI